MKAITISLLIFISLFGSTWCPVTGLKISEHLDTSYSAKFEANDSLRVYASLYGLLKDKENYGLYDIKKYDKQTKKYLHVKILDTLKIEKNPMGEVYKKRYYFMGEKLLKKRCPKNIDVEDYLEISELKEDIQSRCDLESELYLHAVSVYLWDVIREGGEIAKESRVQVKEHEKCPVCGMFTYKYPRWAAQIFYKDGEHEHRYSFDGVKDLMKFYFDPMKWGDYKNSRQKNITKILVTDYYTQKAIDGKKAFFVIRSDIYGPMGHELIAFESESDAQNFKDDHKGKLIIKFEDIIEEEVYKLDVSE